MKKAPFKVFFLFLVFGFWGEMEKKGGHTTTPPLSAECQIERQSHTNARATRV